MNSVNLLTLAQKLIIDQPSPTYCDSVRFFFLGKVQYNIRGLKCFVKSVEKTSFLIFTIK